jgi:hypothetical protein
LERAVRRRRSPAARRALDLASSRRGHALPGVVAATLVKDCIKPGVINHA